MGEAGLFSAKAFSGTGTRGKQYTHVQPTVIFANRLVSLTSADCLLLYQQGIQGYTRVYKGIQGYTRVYKGQAH